MDADPAAPQKGAASFKSLSSQQLYQHDPLFIMLKSKLHLSDHPLVVPAYQSLRGTKDICTCYTFCTQEMGFP
jgi:hypothetical protein